MKDSSHLTVIRQKLVILSKLVIHCPENLSERRNLSASPQSDSKNWFLIVF